MVTSTRAVPSVIMRGLDPRIHGEWPGATILRFPLLHGLMERRVKPGNDRGDVGDRLLKQISGSE